MKHRTLVIAGLLLLLSFSASAGIWQGSYSHALKKAKAENKLVLLYFAGSDWCGWCAKLKEEVLSQKAFIQFADKKLICVLVDFPHKKLSAKVVARNRKLKKQYDVKGYPTLILVNPDQNVVARSGYQQGGAGKYVEHLQAMIGNSEAALVDDEPKETGVPDELADKVKMRVWHDHKGRKLKARLVELSYSYVRLERESGKVIKAKYKNLSKTDQEYVDELTDLVADIKAKRDAKAKAAAEAADKAELASPVPAVAVTKRPIKRPDMKILLAGGGAILFFGILVFRKQIFRDT